MAIASCSKIKPTFFKEGKNELIIRLMDHDLNILEMLQKR